MAILCKMPPSRNFLPALLGKRNNVSPDLSRHQNLNFRIISVNSITILAKKKKKNDDFYLFIYFSGRDIQSGTKKRQLT